MAQVYPVANLLARGIYAGRAFDRLPVPADAAVLAHCRGDGLHARGCWVVDAAPGKE